MSLEPVARLWLLSSLAVVLTLALPARAEVAQAVHATARPGGVEVGLRLGASLPLEPADPELNRQQFSTPLWVDAGYRSSPSWFWGGYAQLAPLITRYGVAPGAEIVPFGYHDSVELSLRLGVHALYSLRTHERLQPWLGAGIGVELNPARPAPRRVAFELGNLQAGVDYLVSPGFGVGLFASASAVWLDEPERDAISNAFGPTPVAVRVGPFAVGRVMLGLRTSFHVL